MLEISIIIIIKCNYQEETFSMSDDWSWCASELVCMWPWQNPGGSTCESVETADLEPSCLCL